MNEDMLVRKIENGTVIDHISSGKGLKVLKILKIDDDNTAVLVSGVKSSKFGKKDIVKVENKELSESEVNKISLFAQNATLNIIEDGRIREKRKITLPKVLEGITKCPNTNCISCSSEPIKSRFLVDRTEPVRLRCFYCERLFSAEEILV
jgi:aspartate carbamoyltransferase regulatory subunit